MIRFYCPYCGNPDADTAMTCDCQRGGKITASFSSIEPANSADRRIIGLLEKQIDTLARHLDQAARQWERYITDRGQADLEDLLKDKSNIEAQMLDGAKKALKEVIKKFNY